MHSFTFDKIIPLKDAQVLRFGTFIWIWHADKIPPHIGISTNGKYFSLKVSGLDVCVPIKNALQVVSKKKIPVVFAQWDVGSSENEILRIFKSYEFANSNGISCLFPLVKIAEMSTCGQLSELLETQQNLGVLKTIYGCNLPENYCALPKYDSKAIVERLEVLENAKRR